MQLCELPKGFHLVPVRDHCRIRTAKWRVSVSCHEQISLQDGFYSWDHTWPKFSYRKVCFYREVHHFEDYQAAKAFVERATAGGYYDTVKLLEPRKRARTEDEMYYNRLSKNCDPMAIQATMILRDVLRSIYNGDFDNQ